MKYVNVLTYCADTTGLKAWLLENRADNVAELEDGTIRIHKNILGAWYEGNESIALMRVRPHEIQEGGEETAPGWLRGTPFEFWAITERNPWLEITESQILKAKQLIGLPLDEEGNEIDQDPFTPAQYAGAS